MTEDGRYLAVDKITKDHLSNIRDMLLKGLPPGYDLDQGRKIAQDGVMHENLYDDTAGIDQSAYAAAWLQLIDDELIRRISV